VNNGAVVQKRRCAVYTRKSSEEGLQMEYNSLDAQREAGEAYIESQKSEGWLLVPDRYDDGGYSGGTLERPALKRLLLDIEHGRVDAVVVYKIDRISRSLMDFAKLVEVFERRRVTFVSVTQSFCTATSMGRLMLNVLLSFAQFEREVTGERIRDKIAASRRKGMWMGGHPPLGYAVKDRKLVIVPKEASLVRKIFADFLKSGSATNLSRSLADAGVTTKGGKPMNKGYLYRVLSNPVVIGHAVHKGVAHPGEHPPIIDRKLWDKVRSIIQASPHVRANGTRARTPALLKGLIFGPTGLAMTPTHTRRKQGPETCPIGRIGAADVEGAVVDQIRTLLVCPEVIVRTWRELRKSVKDLSEAAVRDSLASFGDLWDDLFPAEQARIVQLLVERVDVKPDSLSIRLRAEGLTSLLTSLRAPRGSHAA
jgi:DNA invertase Pin-like site-specific DNA recombinase